MGASPGAAGSPVPVAGRPTALATGSFGPGPGDIAVLAGVVVQVIGSVASAPYAVQSTTVPSVPHAQALTTGFFDSTNGSNPDLAVLDGADGTVSVLLSDGLGNFTLAPGSPVFARGSGSGFGLSIATGDFGLGSDNGTAGWFGTSAAQGLAVSGYLQGGCAEPCVTPTDQVAVLTNDGSGRLSQASGSPYALYG